VNKKDQNIDWELISGMKKNDHVSFRRLFERYSMPLYKFSLAYLKSKEASEDVVQEVFLKIWHLRHDIKTNTSFQSYLFTIALNSIRKQFNQLARLNECRHDLLISLSENSLDLDHHLSYQAMLDRLNELIGQMPEKRREVFVKKKLEGKSLQEIADECSITPKTVEYHITEAMKFLKDKFGKFHLDGLFFFSLFVGR
jgi:RNA polymerase sigma-70 factor (ECF subfamily)